MRVSTLSVFGLCLLISAAIPVAAQPADPSTYVRRSEAAMILLKYAGITVDPNLKTNGVFPDMLDGDWYTPYVATAVMHGILAQDPATKLVYPHRSVSRADFLKMLTKTFMLTTNIPHEYYDVVPGSWYEPYVGLSWRYSLFTEENAHVLLPDYRLTHEEVIRVLLILLTHEPTLRSEQTIFPLRTSSGPPVALHPAPVRTVQASAEPKPVVKVSSMPQAVKFAILSLIRSRESVAATTRNDLLIAINNFRAQHNTAPLTMNGYLERSAQDHAKDMYERGYFSHFTPEGKSYVDRIRDAGYLSPKECACSGAQDPGEDAQEKGPDFVVTGERSCTCEPRFALGENLAKGQLSVTEVMEDWINSPNHRTNMLRPNFTEIGLGLFGDVWVQNFGRLQY